MFYHLFKDDSNYFVTINGKDVEVIFNWFVTFCIFRFNSFYGIIR
jgi:hypothetical protein